jgi:prepilin-type N-terminal cleavage/methylation domain-containing protein
MTGPCSGASRFRRRGFTLVETLTALALAVVVIAIAGAGWDLARRVAVRQARARDALRHRVAILRLARELRAAARAPVAAETGFRIEPDPDRPDASLLAFVTSAPDGWHAAGPDLRLTIRMEPPPGAAVLRIAAPQVGPGAESALTNRWAEGAKYFRAEALDGTTWSADWASTAAKPLPAAVRLTTVLESGSARETNRITVWIPGGVAVTSRLDRSRSALAPRTPESARGSSLASAPETP